MKIRFAHGLLSAALVVAAIGCEKSPAEREADAVRDATQQQAEGVRNEAERRADAIEDSGERRADTIERQEGTPPPATPPNP